MVYVVFYIVSCFCANALYKHCSPVTVFSAKIKATANLILNYTLMEMFASASFSLFGFFKIHEPCYKYLVTLAMCAMFTL